MGEAILSMNAVTNDWPHAFAAFVDIPFLSAFAAFPDGGMAPSRIAGKESHQVEDMRAEDHQVLPAATGVFFAAAAKFQQVAQFPFGDQLFDTVNPWAVARLMRDREFH